MAILFSNEQTNRARKKYLGKFYFINDKLKIFQILINKLLIYFFNFKISIINLKRKFMKLFLKISSNNKSGQSNILLNIDDNKIKNISKELKEKDYIFVPNFIENECYLNILNNWPNINFFKQNNNIIKYLSVGFRCREGIFSEEDEKIIKLHPELKNLYEFLLSLQFKKVINSILSFENKDFYIQVYAKKSSILRLFVYKKNKSLFCSVECLNESEDIAKIRQDANMILKSFNKKIYLTGDKIFDIIQKRYSVLSTKDYKILKNFKKRILDTNLIPSPWESASGQTRLNILESTLKDIK